MRTILLAVALAGFVGLGVMDLAAGDLKHGVPALLLAAANGLLLT